MIKIIFTTLLLTFYLSADTIVATGTIVSDNKKYIGARYMGYVKKVFAQIGDSVRREDTLFEMESAEFDILKEQANLALKQAETMVDVYRSRLNEVRREKALIHNKNNNKGLDYAEWSENLEISAEHSQSMLSSMQVLVEEASQKVKEISVISNYLEVKAPSDGIIVQKNLHVGDLIMPGFPVMILLNLNHLEIEAQVSETDLLKVNEGDSVRFEIPSIKYKGHGRIKSIVPSANPMTHTFTIRISFKRSHPKIYPGMYTKIMIEYNPNQLKETVEK